MLCVVPGKIERWHLLALLDCPVLLENWKNVCLNLPNQELSGTFAFNEALLDEMAKKCVRKATLANRLKSVKFSEYEEHECLYSVLERWSWMSKYHTIEALYWKVRTYYSMEHIKSMENPEREYYGSLEKCADKLDIYTGKHNYSNKVIGWWHFWFSSANNIWSQKRINSSRIVKEDKNFIFFNYRIINYQATPERLRAKPHSVQNQARWRFRTKRHSKESFDHARLCTFRFHINRLVTVRQSKTRTKVEYRSRAARLENDEMTNVSLYTPQSLIYDVRYVNIFMKVVLTTSMTPYENVVLYWVWFGPYRYASQDPLVSVFGHFWLSRTTV